MTVSRDPDFCPRCGEAVYITGPDDWTCGHVGCDGYWPSARAWQRENTARDVSGTKAVPIKKYLETRGKGTLQGDLEELVSLVRAQCYGEFAKAVNEALAGRRSMTAAPDFNRNQQQFHTVHGQIAVLNGMLDWIEAQGGKKP